MQKELPIVNLRANGPALIAVPDNSAPNDLYSTSSGIITGKFKGGLNTIVHVGDYWMVGDFEKTVTFTSVAIGSQIWSTTNLDVTSYRDGTPIPQVTDPTQWANLTTGAWCYYNNDSSNGNTYGKLYNWYAVAGIHDNDPNTPNKILSPIGWHIPSDIEWTTLTDFLGGESVSGNKIKESGILHWTSPNTGADNISGFTALPGGARYNDGVFSSPTIPLGGNGFYWSSTENNSTMSYDLMLSYFNGYVSLVPHPKGTGESVRCLMD
ncbi:MAG: fibrobacter succinogenes major paralogous domain-containing protein [Bacteroidia bacterium]|nr:fibrobacter succinogenes major paralogous domain-containing protein [Bacteroidia bacterium]